jgi:hypothetical protein
MRSGVECEDCCGVGDRESHNRNVRSQEPVMSVPSGMVIRPSLKYWINCVLDSKDHVIVEIASLWLPRTLIPSVLRSNLRGKELEGFEP